MYGCNLKGVEFTGHCQIEYLLTWRVCRLEIILLAGERERSLTWVLR